VVRGAAEMLERKDNNKDKGKDKGRRAGPGLRA
jgi:hypothetical protein